MSRQRKRRPRAGAANQKNGRAGQGQRNGSFVPAVNLRGDQLAYAYRCAADVALSGNRAAVILGIGPRGLEVCDDRCCIDRPGALIVVPDVLIAEGIANGHPDPPKGPVLQRADGRTAHVFRARSAAVA